MGIYRNTNNKINFRLSINKNISLKAFYLSVKNSDRIYKFKYIYSDYKRYNNGNINLFIHLLGLNIIFYINGLKENKETYKKIINY